MFVQAIKRGYGHLYLSSPTKCPVDSYLNVFLIEALLEVLNRGAPRDMRVCAHEIKREYECMCFYEYVPVIFTFQ